MVVPPNSDSERRGGNDAHVARILNKSNGEPGRKKGTSKGKDTSMDDNMSRIERQRGPGGDCRRACGEEIE